MIPTRRKVLSRSQRQAAILRGAATAFATKGFAATSMEEVAAASGITKEIVYRHFASKEALYRAVLIWLDLGDPTRDEEFAQRCLVGVEALHAAWAAPVGKRCG